jgi:hypothetical protein
MRWFTTSMAAPLSDESPPSYSHHDSASSLYVTIDIYYHASNTLTSALVDDGSDTARSRAYTHSPTPCPS